MKVYVNAPEPPNHNFNVTITLPVWIHDIPEGVTLEQAAKIMTYSQWNEGRYPFDSELIHEGLRRVIQYAFREALGEQLQEKYGREMVPYVSDAGNKGEMARWSIELDKIKGPYVAIKENITKASFEQQCGKCRGDGKVLNWTDNGHEEETCPKCGGTGVEK